FCGKPGHKAYFCWTRPQPNKETFGKDPGVGTFLSQGTVEVDGVETPVTILRDSGCHQTLIKEGVVAARKTDKTSFWAPFGVKVQLLWFFRDSTSCLYNSLSLEGRFANPIASQDISSAVNAVTGRVALIAAQEQEVSLRLLFDLVSDPANDSGPTTRYLSQDCVLCCRWLPPTMSEEDADWASITQIVLPHTYRQHVLALAHDARAHRLRLAIPEKPKELHLYPKGRPKRRFVSLPRRNNTLFDESLVTTRVSQNSDWCFNTVNFYRALDPKTTYLSVFLAATTLSLMRVWRQPESLKIVTGVSTPSTSTVPCDKKGLKVPTSGSFAKLSWKRSKSREARTETALSRTTPFVKTNPIGMLSALLKSAITSTGDESFGKDPDVGTFRPFLSQGTVEVDGVETPVTILRDSGCHQTFIKEGVVAVRKTDKTSFWAPFGVKVQLLWFFRYARCFPLCAVTRFLLMTNDHNVTPDVDNSLSSEGRFANPIASQDISSAVNAVTGRVALIAAQEQTVSLRLLFDLVSDPANDSGPTTRYLSQDSRAHRLRLAIPEKPKELHLYPKGRPKRRFVSLPHRNNTLFDESLVTTRVSQNSDWCFDTVNFYRAFFRGKPGHKAYFCWTRPQPNKESFAKDPDVGTFRPFLSQGTVEVDGVETPVTILRDSGCLQTPIKEGVVAVRKTDKTSFWAPFGVKVQLLWFFRVDLILGNDLLQQLEDDMPDNSLSLEGRFANPIASQDISSAVNAVTGRVALIAVQEQEVSLRLLFDLVSNPANNSGPTTRYLSQDCVFFCGKPGHKAYFCWTRPQPNKESFGKDPGVGTFLSQGTVEVDGVETPVTILRDSGCHQTLIKEGVVAARKTDKTSFWAPFGVKVQLLWFFRVDLILGNDLLQQLEDDMPGVFPYNSLSLEGRFANPIASQDISSPVNAVTGRVALIAAQEQEVSLRLLFDLVSDPASDSGPTTRYLSQ
ncbi:hypothetical protein Hamer_G026857, partial [Homarus americanus]